MHQIGRKLNRQTNTSRSNGHACCACVDGDEISAADRNVLHKFDKKPDLNHRDWFVWDAVYDLRDSEVFISKKGERA